MDTNIIILGILVVVAAVFLFKKGSSKKPENKLPVQPRTPVIENSDVLFGGNFSQVNSTFSQYFAKVNKDGVLDTNFKIISQVPVSEIYKQRDGKFLISGSFKLDRGRLTTVARFDSSGKTDQTFLCEANNRVNSIFELTLGKIMLAGDFSWVSGVNVGRLVRIKSNGELDSSFNYNIISDGGVYKVAQTTESNIFAAGWFKTQGSDKNSAIVKIDQSGNLVKSFNCEVDGGVNDFKELADGKIIICGKFNKVNGSPRKMVALLNSDGSLNESINLNLIGNLVSGIRQLSNGNVALFGSFKFGDAIQNLLILDRNFNVSQKFIGIANNSDNSYSYVSNLIETENETYLIYGKFNSYKNTAVSNCAKIDKFGNLIPGTFPNITGGDVYTAITGEK